MTFSSGFTNGYILMIDVADLANRCFTDGQNHSHLAGRKSYLRILSFFRHQLRAVSRRTNQLAAFTRCKLNIVNNCTYGNRRNRKGVTRFDICCCTGNYCVSNFQANRCQNVSLLAVLIFHQCDMSASVRIVFQCFYRCRHIHFISFKIDNSIFSLVAAASVTNSNSAVAVSAGVFL